MAATPKNSAHLDELKDIVKRTGGKYLTEDEKMDLAHSEMPLTFTSIKITTSQWGPRYELEFLHDKKVRALTIPVRPEREDMMKRLTALVKKNKSVGPLILTVSQSADGERKFFWFKVA